MNRLHHFIEPPVGAPYRLWLAMLAVIAAAVGLGGLSFEYHRRASAAELAAEQLRKTRTVKPIPRKSRAVEEEQKRWADLQAERNFPWNQVLSVVEQGVNPDIELLEFVPDKATRQILLRGEARDRQALMKFMVALAAQPLMHNVHLASQERIKRERLETWHFEVKATVLQ